MQRSAKFANDRGAKVAAARLSVGSNAFLILLKLAAGLATGSVGVLSEAAHSGTDLAAALIAYFSVRLADQPADEEHPYGHGKVESLSAMAEATLIILAALWIIYEGIDRLIHPHFAPGVGLGIGVMALSAAINTFLVRYLLRVARATDSPALRADAVHLRTDVFTSLSVLVGLVLVRVTQIAVFDAIVALGVAILILFAAWGLARGALEHLMDVQLPERDVQAVRDVLDSEPGVKGYHKLRTRKSGSARHVDAHVLLDDNLSLVDAHDLTEKLEDRMREALPNAEITLHTEPYRAEQRHQHEQHGGPAPED